MHEGYFTYDGTEIINVARTEAYAADRRWFRPQFENPDLRTVLGHSAYTDPATDNAPWYDPDNPITAEFFGAYPLDITGVDDSTHTGLVVENIGDGGVVTAPRKGTKVLVFNLVLLAASDAGAEVGKQWLKRILTAPLCQPVTCLGADLTYFAAEPRLSVPPDRCVGGVWVPSSPTDAQNRLLRTLRRVSTTVGLTDTAKRRTTDGGAAWSVQMTLTAGNPAEFGVSKAVLDGWMQSGVTNPWPGGVTPSGGSLVTTPYSVTDEPCFDPQFQPVYDPLYPTIVAPPPAPDITWHSSVPPTTWDRRRFVLPAQFVPEWEVVHPIISLTTTGADVDTRNIRVRIYPDRLGTGDMDPDEPCDFVSDLVVTYIPPLSTLTIDAAGQAVYLSQPPNVVRRADTLVTDSHGEPFVWPALSCGLAHVVAVDTQPGEATPYVDFSLVGKSA